MKKINIQKTCMRQPQKVPVKAPDLDILIAKNSLFSQHWVWVKSSEKTPRRLIGDFRLQKKKFVTALTSPTKNKFLQKISFFKVSKVGPMP